MPPQGQTLAQMVRAKYPGAYDDMDDAALESAVKAKFPGIYDDLPTSQQPKRAEAQPGVLGTMADLGIGAAKGVGDTVATLGSLVHKIPGVSAAVDALYGTPGVSQASFREAERVTTPSNTAQTIGKGVEQIAEVLIPGSKVAAATRGMRLPARMGAEAVSSAGVSTAQGGDPISAGVVGAAVPVIGGALGSRAATALRESAQKKVAQALGAQKERFKAIAEKRAPEILRRGLSGSRQTLLRDATENARAAGAAIDDVLKGAGDQVVPTQAVVDALEDAKRGFMLDRELSIPEAMRTGAHRQAGAQATNAGGISVPIVLDQRPIDQLTKLQDTMRALGDAPTVNQLVAVRRVWDEVVNQAGGYSHRSGSTFGLPLAEKTEAWAKREGTKAIRAVLAEAVPDLAKINKEFSFWADLKSVLRATEARTQAQSQILPRVITSTVGAGSGFSSGDSMGERLTNAAAGAVFAPKVIQILTSARWRLIGAGLRNALADAIESGSPGRIASAAARIAAVGTGRVTASSEPAAGTTRP